jgi:hypothetical protein
VALATGYPVRSREQNECARVDCFKEVNGRGRHAAEGAMLLQEVARELQYNIHVAGQFRSYHT